MRCQRGIAAAVVVRHTLNAGCDEILVARGSRARFVLAHALEALMAARARDRMPCRTMSSSPLPKGLDGLERGTSRLRAVHDASSRARSRVNPRDSVVISAHSIIPPQMR